MVKINESMLLFVLLLGGCSMAPSASSVETIEDAEKLLSGKGIELVKTKDETQGLTVGERACTYEGKAGSSEEGMELRLFQFRSAKATEGWVDYVEGLSFAATEPFEIVALGKVGVAVEGKGFETVANLLRGEL